MTPVGKLTFAIIGFRFFGLAGFLWGMLLGHIIIDRSLVKKIIKQKLSEWDDCIRLLLPFRLYCVYNRLQDHTFGKIWGALLGGLTYGWSGLVVLFFVGHTLFDAKRTPFERDFRYALEDFWNANLGKLAGGIVGFSLHSHLLIFAGILCGFVIDEFRLGGQLRNNISSRFWKKLNVIKLALRSNTAQNVSFIQSMAGLSAKIAKADGIVSENEIHVFKKIFNADRNPKIARTFNEAKQNTEGYQRYAKQLKVLSRNNLDMKESIIESLFKIAAADGEILPNELAMFDDIADIIEIPQGNYTFIKNKFVAKPQDEETHKDYEILGVFFNASDKEIKQRWKELINTYHPDKAQANGANPEEIAACTQKMAEINSAYEHIMKQRKAS